MAGQLLLSRYFDMLAFFSHTGYNKEARGACRQEVSAMTFEEMEERDIVEFTDDAGNTLLLEVMDYFFYNGEEFAALCDAKENPTDDDPDDDPVYIMKVNVFTDEDGEEMEEFVSPDESLMDKLIQVVRTRFGDSDDEDEEEEE